MDQTLHAASLFALAQWLESWQLPALHYGAAWLALTLLANRGIGYGIDLYLARFQLNTIEDGQGLLKGWLPDRLDGAPARCRIRIDGLAFRRGLPLGGEVDFQIW